MKASANIIRSWEGGNLVMKENFLPAAPARVMRKNFIHLSSPIRLWPPGSWPRKWAVLFLQLPSWSGRCTSSTSGYLGPLWPSPPGRWTPRWSRENTPRDGEQEVLSRFPGDLRWEMDIFNEAEQTEGVADARWKSTATKKTVRFQKKFMLSVWWCSGGLVL